MSNTEETTNPSPKPRKTRKPRKPKADASKVGRQPKGSTGDLFAAQFAKADKSGNAIELFATDPATVPMTVNVGLVNVRTIPLAEVYVPADFNSRKVLWGSAESGEDLETLAADLKERGLLNPITVYEAPGPDGKVRYALVAGERRLRALQYLGADMVTAHIRAGSAEQAHGDNDAENAFRKDLAPWEIATECVRLRQSNHTLKEIGRKLRLSESSASNYIRVHDNFTLIPELWADFQAGRPAIGEALAILADARKVPHDPSKRDDQIRALRVAWEAWKGGAKGGDKPERPEAPPKPKGKEIRGIAEEMALLLTPGALDDAELRAKIEGALWALRWTQGEETVTAFKRGHAKALKEAHKRASAAGAPK